MKKVKYMIYCKILYNINKDIIFLRKNLSEYSCKGIFLTKKETENYGIKQYINTFLININNENNNINKIITIVNKIDYLQILGVIKNNILIIDYSKDIKHDIFYTYKLILNIFIIKKIILVPFKIILNKK
jgi:hypothetical protein